MKKSVVVYWHRSSLVESDAVQKSLDVGDKRIDLTERWFTMIGSNAGKGVKKIIALVMVLVMAVSAGVMITSPAQAAGTKAQVKKMYKQINKFRKTKKIWYWKKGSKSKKYFNTKKSNKLKKLKRNKKLEKTAKKRAKDLAKEFKNTMCISHQRPNGKSCFSIYPKKLKACGENIAYTGAEVSVEDVMEGFIEEDQKYRGQGHRRNMLNKKFNAVGVAAYKTHGIVFWVQSFGRY